MQDLAVIIQRNEDADAARVAVQDAFEAARWDVQELVTAMAPPHFAIEVDESEEAVEALTDRWGRAGAMRVSNSNSDSTIFFNPQSNFAMRAWHDLIHVMLGVGFDEDGELAVAKAHQRSARIALRGLPFDRLDNALAVLWADTEGQQQHFRKHGVFPVDQLAFAAAVFKRFHAVVAARPVFGDSNAWVGAATHVVNHNGPF